jgi:sec-independent protein translocase protein TatC
MEDPKGDLSPQPGDSPDTKVSETEIETSEGQELVQHQPVTDQAYIASDYAYGPSQPGHTMPYGPQPTAVAPAVVEPSTPSPPKPAQSSGSGGGGRSLPPPPSDDEDEEESGMLRMSFLEHLEELRRRIFWALAGFGVAFFASLTFCNKLWEIVSAPAVGALTSLGINPPDLTQITPMESFNVIWVKTPVLCSIFLSSPWLVYQVWAFVSPGLYKRERRWAVPFVVCTAGLFITGGIFAYFVAFRYGLTFLLGIGRDVHVRPMVSINEYFDLFVNVTLGIGLVFELPVLIFFLTLLRLVTPGFLIRNSRYAILLIVILAAVVTPTPDVFNLLLFATPMILLFYVGVLASWVLVLNREGKRFPWGKVLMFLALALVIMAAVAYFAAIKMHYYFIPKWPFFIR